MLATTLSLAFGGAAEAQLRVGAEADLAGAGPGDGPVLSHDSTRGGWLSFWFSDEAYNEAEPDPRLVVRHVSADARPKHDANTLFDAGLPITAAFDPVADEHVLTTGGSDYGSTGRVQRFSPMGELTSGPWTLEPGSMLPNVALDPRTGAGIVAYLLERETSTPFVRDPGVWVQRLAAGGGPQGAPVRVSQEGTKVDLHRPAVAFNPTRGEFAIAWRERRSGLPLLVGDIIVSRLPAGAGGPVGVPVAISDSRAAITAQAPGGIPDGAGAPGLAYDPATAGYLATWLGARGDVLEGPTQVYGQRLDADVREVGADDFRISAGPGLIDLHAFPTVVANDGMVVVWARWIGDEHQVVGRRVAAGPPTDPALLWTSEEGLTGSPELVGPASGPLLLGMGVDFASSVYDHPQVRLLGDGPDPGSAQIASAPPGTSASRTAAFALESGRPGGALQCRLDEGSWRTCAPVHEESKLRDGRHRLQVRAIGPDRWVQVTPAAASWRVEAAAPDTRITEAPAANERYDFFYFEADEPATLECRYDDGAWSNCTSSPAGRGYERQNLADGPHRFEVRATDDAGRVDPTPALWVWTVDATAPETTVVDGPSDGTALPATFTFASNEQDVRYECSSNASGNPWSACESGVPFPTARGQLYVRAIDAVGNVDSSPAQWSWSTDTTPGTVSFDLPADSVLSSPDLVAGWSVSNDQGTGKSVEECRLDGAAWERCLSPLFLFGLADGPHALQVRTTDEVRNVSAPAELRFSVDTHRPATVVLAKPRSRTLQRTAQIVFRGTTDATFTCSIDGAAPQPCVSPLVLNNVAVGSHTVALRATGTGGWTQPTPATVAWTVETDPNAPAPAGLRAARATQSLAAAPPNTFFDLTPDENERENRAFFEWDWNDVDDVVGSECRLDGADWAACETPLQLEGLAEGAHHFEARTVNSAGVRDPSPASFDWTIDTITSHVLFQRIPRQRTNEQVATAEFRADRAGATLECRSADTAWQPCTSPYTATGQPEGAYRLIVRAVNRGLIGPARTVNWIIDRTPPDTAISSARVSPGTTTSRTELDYTVRVIGYAAEEWDDGYVEPEFYITQCRVDGGPWTYCFESNTLRNLADGPHVIEVRATDYAGNVDPTPARLDWTVDTRPADTVIDSGPAATEQSRSATFALRAVPAGGGFECRLDAGAWRACAATHTLDLVAGGSHTFEARATGGGTPDPTPARWLWTVDTGPTPTVVSGPPALTGDATARFHLASDHPAARLDCALDGGAWQTCGTDPVFAGLADGDHTLAVRAVDGGGRAGALAEPWRWTVDTQPPDTLLVSGPEPVRRWSDVEVAFRASEPGARFECHLDARNWSRCANPYWLGTIGNGTYRIEVRAIDAVGHVDASPLIVTWRSDPVRPSPRLTASPAMNFYTTRTSASFTVTAGEPLTAVDCRVDRLAWTPCRDGVTFSGLSEGPHTVETRVVDEAGNVGTDSLPWWIAPAPDTELLRRPAAADSIGFSNFEFSGDFNTFSFVCSLDGGAWQACTSPKSFSPLPEGQHVAEVAAVTLAGERDPTPARWEWAFDDGKPNTTIVEGPPATTTDRTAHFVFSSSVAGSSFICALNGASYAPCPTPHTLAGLGVRPHTLVVRAVAPDGTLGSFATWNWRVTAASSLTRDESAPTARSDAGEVAPPQVARGAAEALARALEGRRWRSILSGKRRLELAGAPGVLAVEVRAAGRLVATARVRMTAAGEQRVALRPHRRARPGVRAAVRATWRPAQGAQQAWRLTARLRRAAQR